MFAHSTKKSHQGKLVCVCLGGVSGNSRDSWPLAKEVGDQWDIVLLGPSPENT